MSDAPKLATGTAEVHHVVLVRCDLCDWTRSCDEPGQARAAASVHALLHGGMRIQTGGDLEGVERMARWRRYVPVPSKDETRDRWVA